MNKKISPSPLLAIFHILIPTSLTLILKWSIFIVNTFEANFCLGGGTPLFVGQFGEQTVGTWLATFRITQDMRGHGHQFPAATLNTKFARLPPSYLLTCAHLHNGETLNHGSFSPEQ